VRQLLDEQPPQLLELHELELHELDDEQFELESEELDVEPDEPPPRAAMGGTGGGSISAIECAAHAVPASAPAPNNAVAHSTASGESGSSRRARWCSASAVLAPTVRPPRPNPVRRRVTIRYAIANTAMLMTSSSTGRPRLSPTASFAAPVPSTASAIAREPIRATRISPASHSHAPLRPRSAFAQSDTRRASN